MGDYPTLEGVDYLYDVPEAVPEGRIVVHNHVIPAPTLGERGFRAWTEPEGTPNREECACPWARHLTTHYRVASRTFVPRSSPEIA